MSFINSYYDTIRDIEYLKSTIILESIENKIFLTESAIGELINSKPISHSNNIDIHDCVNCAEDIRNKFINNIKGTKDDIERRIIKIKIDPKVKILKINKDLLKKHDFMPYKKIFNIDSSKSNIDTGFDIMSRDNSDICKVIDTEKNNIRNDITCGFEKLDSYKFNSDSLVDSLDKFENLLNDISRLYYNDAKAIANLNSFKNVYDEIYTDSCKGGNCDV